MEAAELEQRVMFNARSNPDVDERMARRLVRARVARGTPFYQKDVADVLEDAAATTRIVDDQQEPSRRKISEQAELVWLSDASTPTSSWLEQYLEDALRPQVEQIRQEVFGRSPVFRPSEYDEGLALLREMAADGAETEPTEKELQIESQIKQLKLRLEELTGERYKPLTPTRHFIPYHPAPDRALEYLPVPPGNGPLKRLKENLVVLSDQTGLHEADLLEHVLADLPLRIVRAHAYAPQWPTAKDLPPLLRTRVVIEVRTPDISYLELLRLYQRILPQLWPPAASLEGDRTVPPGLLTEDDVELDALVRETGGPPNRGVGQYWRDLARRWPRDIGGDALRKRYERMLEKIDRIVTPTHAGTRGAPAWRFGHGVQRDR